MVSRCRNLLTWPKPTEIPVAHIALKYVIFSQLLGEPHTRTEVIETLKQCVKKVETLNWETLLLTITVWEQSESASSSQMMFSLLKEVIRELVESGVNEENEDFIMAAFILGRHCCLISPQNFSRYEKWYAKMFENEQTSPANTCTTFEYLAKVLTSWVPFEPPCFLQVHAAYWPFIPQGMRHVWNDYVSVSKARITEFNEIEQAMGYEPNPNNPVRISRLGKRLVCDPAYIVGRITLVR